MTGLLSFPTACLAYTLSEAALFGWVREHTKAWNQSLGKLVSCGYCSGHWLAFALVAIYRPRLFYAWGPLDYFLTALVIAWLAAFQWVALCWVLGRTGK